ncbi:MAG TPA: phosphoribosylanthranilate isomerase, partial [Candidatus Glassbacteria bacterium]|nr:phosphoribosylanthranilate isomerase [Candidatus Glassbacteria bacterium]
MSVRVKICGITRREDALAACELGADALGFIFHRLSPRYVAPEAVREIVSALPSFVATVGVVVDLPAEEISRLAGISGVDRVQLSGDESPEFCNSLGLHWFKAIKIRREEDIERLENFGACGTYLLETYVEGLAGGTGKSFNWEWAARAGRFGRIILAGGLTPD